MIRASTFAGRRVAVFGLGGSGIATVASLAAGRAIVAAWDDGERSRDAAAKAGVPLVDLRSADWTSFAALVLAPGVPYTHPTPHWTVAAARAAGVEVIGDIEIFCRERRARAPGSPFIAITGTNGKSTTTALIAHILRLGGHDVQMGGNIGRAILTLEAPLTGFALSGAQQQSELSAAPSVAHQQPGLFVAPLVAHQQPARRIHVVEMSSFQIDLTPSLDPTVGVLLNLSADHLDRHGPADDPALAMRNYAAIKERLAVASEAVAIGTEDRMTCEILERIVDAGGSVYPFTTGKGGAIVPSLYAIGSTLFALETDAARSTSTEIASLAGAGTLRGRHNAQNALAALAALRALQDRLDAKGGVAGAPVWQPAVLANGLASYPGLPHRMEQVGRIGRVIFINDSKATNADSTEKALAAFERDIFWILGGKPKEGGIQSLEPYFQRVAKAYLIGEASDDFAATLEGKVAYERAGTLDAALARATADAANSVGAEPVVLLSPACASYDQFRSFEHRGDTFRELVRALSGVVAGTAP
jgi:UDP-N-acetylmuramoylalanine--D-glutamate ligase